MASVGTTNPDGSSTTCYITSSTPGEKKLVDTKIEDCQRDFTCQYQDTGWQTQVKCPGKMKVYHYEQEVTNNWSCTVYFDRCSYTYSYTEKVTNTWTENGDCEMGGDGSSCCPDGSLPVGNPGGTPDAWPDPITVPPDFPNPFR
jgi:hypothetical protein